MLVAPFHVPENKEWTTFYSKRKVNYFLKLHSYFVTATREIANKHGMGSSL